MKNISKNKMLYAIISKEENLLRGKKKHMMEFKLKQGGKTINLTNKFYMKH